MKVCKYNSLGFIPAEYRQLKAIRTKGGQIDTGVTFTTNYAKFEIENLCYFVDGTWYPCGTSFGRSGTYFHFFMYNNKLGTRTGSTQNLGLTAWVLNTYYKLVVTANAGTESVQFNSYSGSITYGGTVASANTFKLFNIGSEYGDCSMGRVKVYAAAGVLACDLVPCMRRSDSVCGMWDLVNKKFLTSTNSTTFTAIEDELATGDLTVDSKSVALMSNGTDYMFNRTLCAGKAVQVDYIQGGPGNCIDTLIQPDANTQVDCTFAIVSFGMWSGILGCGNGNTTPAFLMCNYYGRQSISVSSGSVWVAQTGYIPINYNTFYDVIFRHGYYKIGSTERTYSSTWSAVGKNICIISANSGNSSVAVNATSKWRKFKLTNKSTGAVLAELYPCILIADIDATMDSQSTARTAGTVGMWDMVSNKFFGNSGSGSLTYG